MKFTDEEIQLAKKLKRSNVPWTPSVGHYVLDETGVVQRGSPFQEGVYFVLNYDHFMSLAGGVDRFHETMLWLPTWEDCRELLRDLKVPDNKVVRYLSAANAIEHRTERTALYELILSHLEASD